MKLSNETMTALAAAGQAYAAPYAHLAATLATAIGSAKTQAETAKGAKQTVWDGFKSAMGIAAENGHNAAALRAGLEIACINAGIPSGSFRGYVGTIGNLYADVLKPEGEAGHIALSAAVALSVKDARDRYKPEPTNLEKLHAKLAAAVKDWNEEEMALLLSIVDDMTPERLIPAETPEAGAEEASPAPVAAAA